MINRLIESAVERAVNRLRFFVERLTIRGPIFRLLVVGAMVGLVAVLAGTFVYGVGETFQSLGDAIWWAFLRLTDPGYLGDDKGALARSVSTLVTILGYVLFMGALIAIMTQWFQAFMRRLEAGRTPVTMADHVVILGWTNRTVAIARELFHSQRRVRRFLERHRVKRLRVAVLAHQVDADKMDELRMALGRQWDPRALVLRSGSLLQIADLRLVDARHAAAIVLPSSAAEADEHASADGRALKAMLAIAAGTRDLPPDERPLLVAEIRDARRIRVARQAYGAEMEVVASDQVVARLLAQALRHPGLSFVFGELLSHEVGAEIYARHIPELAGKAFSDLPKIFPDAIPIGLTRPEGGSFAATLRPPPDTCLDPSDRVVLVAADYERTAPEDTAMAATASVNAPDPTKSAQVEVVRRVLVLGWNRTLPALLDEFERHERERVELTLVSLVPPPLRDDKIRSQGVELQRTNVTHVRGDITSHADLARVDPAAFDNVLLVASDWTQEDDDRDARTLLAFLVLRETLADVTSGPSVTVELLSEENVHLLPTGTQVVVSPLLVSHMLTQIALRRELRAVYDALFGPGGADLSFRSASDYGVTDGSAGFADLRRRGDARGEIVLGVRRARRAQEADAGVLLNPPSDLAFDLEPRDDIVVLAR